MKLSDFSRIHFEQSPLSVQILSPEGKTLAVNRAWKDLWQIPDDVIENYILKDYKVGEDPQLELKGIGDFIRKGLAGEKIEIPAIRYDPTETGIKGDPKWVSGYMYPVKDEEGVIVEIILTQQDITAKKIAEEELRKSRDQLKAIFEGVLDGILVQDTNFRPVYANEAAAILCGFKSADELCQAGLEELLNSFELLDEARKPFPREHLPARLVLTGSGPQKDIIMCTRKLATGKETWSEVSATPILDESGKPYLAVSIFRDITEEKQRQERENFLNQASIILSNSLDYHQTLNQIAKLAVARLADWCSIDVREEGGPKRVAVAHKNPKMLKIAEELNQKYPPDWNSPTGAPNVLRTGAAELFSEIPEEMLAKYAKNDEHYQIIKKLGLKSAMIVPLCLGERVLGAISFIGAESGRVYSETDLEMAKELGLRSALALENARLYRKSEKLAEDLQNAVSARDEFISICSHELKTPITSMKLQFELAARKLMDDDKSVFTTESYQKQIDTTNRQLDRMTRLIDEMLDISRINTGKLTMEENTISLNELLEETLSRFIDQFESKKISVTLDLGTDECIVKGDKFRLDQVFSNILTNAMKYGAAKPVKISMHQTQDAIRVEFADQGIGIQPQDLTRVFNRFERVSSAGNITGLGLGLFISQQIVQAHGGMIWAEINAAKGSTFVVELPQLKKSITGL